MRYLFVFKVILILLIIAAVMIMAQQVVCAYPESRCYEGSLLPLTMGILLRAAGRCLQSVPVFPPPQDGAVVTSLERAQETAKVLDPEYECSSESTEEI